jgi:hypothetical protein
VDASNPALPAEAGRTFVLSRRRQAYGPSGNPMPIMLATSNATVTRKI